jgi:hypothetical protein
VGSGVLEAEMIHYGWLASVDHPKQRVLNDMLDYGT